MFQKLIYSIQAQRRQQEDLRWLGPATSIRAKIYPHQVYAVQQLINAPQIRHVLSAEVGMGKTVIALMLQNIFHVEAKRASRTHRTLIVVPKPLLIQWYTECAQRLHLMPRISESHQDIIIDQIQNFAIKDPMKAVQYRVSLAELTQTLRGTPDNLIQEFTAPTEQEEQSFCICSHDEIGDYTNQDWDYIIVDEPQKMNAVQYTQLRSITETAQSVLFLSATLRLSNSSDIALNIRTLDPLRFKQFCWSEGAFTLTAQNLLVEQFGTFVAPNIDEYQITLKRSSWPDLFPERIHKPIWVDAFDEELEAYDLVQDYVNHTAYPFGNANVISPEMFAQVAAKGLGSVRVTLRRTANYDGTTTHRADLMQLIYNILGEVPRDSSLDALCDITQKILFEQEKGPNRKMVIATEDSSSAEAVYKMLDFFFGDTIEIYTISENQNQHGDLFYAVKQFQDTKAPSIFIMRRDSYTGLNLQVSRHIVLFALPLFTNRLNRFTSELSHIEQLIGRVDRLGNSAIQTDGDIAKPIMVYTIAKKNTIQEKTIRILQDLQVFTKPYHTIEGDIERTFEQYFPNNLRTNTNWEEFRTCLYKLMQGTDNEDATIHHDSISFARKIEHEPPLEPANTVVKYIDHKGNQAYLRSVKEDITPAKDIAFNGWLYSFTQEHQRLPNAYQSQVLYGGSDLRSAIRNSPLRINSNSIQRIESPHWLYIATRRDLLQALPSFLTPVHRATIPTNLSPILESIDQLGNIVPAPPMDVQLPNIQAELQKIQQWRWLRWFQMGDQKYDPFVQRWADDQNARNQTRFGISMSTNAEGFGQLNGKTLAIQLHRFDIANLYTNLSSVSDVTEAQKHQDIRQLRSMIPANFVVHGQKIAADGTHYPISNHLLNLLLRPLHLNEQEDAVPLPEYRLYNGNAAADPAALRTALQEQSNQWLSNSEIERAIENAATFIEDKIQTLQTVGTRYADAAAKLQPHNRLHTVQRKQLEEAYNYNRHIVHLKNVAEFLRVRPVADSAKYFQYSQIYFIHIRD